jgi:hypothetical protein
LGLNHRIERQREETDKMDPSCCVGLILLFFWPKEKRGLFGGCSFPAINHGEIPLIIVKKNRKGKNNAKIKSNEKVKENVHLICSDSIDEFVIKFG